MRRVLLFIALVALAAPLGAQQIPLWRPAPQSDPAEFGSPRLDPAFALAPPPGHWQVTTVVSQFNLWGHTWHTFAAHRETNRYGLDITPEELRSIERNWAHENVYHLDVAGWRSDVYVARGFSRGSVVVRVPWIDIGGLHWDAFPEMVHELLDVSNLEREVFARRDTLIYLKDKYNNHVIEGRKELNGDGFGDVAVALNARGPELWGAATTLIASVELPAGREGTLRGSGGIDAGIGAVMVWERGRKTWKAGAGATYLDRDGDFLGEPRADLYHLFGEVDRPIGKGFVGTIGVRIDGSPLAAVIGGYAGHPATYYRFGIARAIGRTGWFAFDIGEELLPQTGVEADFSAHLTFGTAAFETAARAQKRPGRW